MKLSGSYQIKLEKQKVWEALNDPEILKKSIPGCDEFKKDTDTEFTPKLFSEDVKQDSNNSIEEENFYKSEDENLFEPGVSDDDDFEIPAFLRKQKF